MKINEPLTIVSVNCNALVKKIDANSVCVQEIQASFRVIYHLCLHRVYYIIKNKLTSYKLSLGKVPLRCSRSRQAKGKKARPAGTYFY